jgi:hypothetical protein
VRRDNDTLPAIEASNPLVGERLDAYVAAFDHDRVIESVLSKSRDRQPGPQSVRRRLRMGVLLPAALGVVAVASATGLGYRGSTGCGLRLSENPRRTNQWLTYQDSTTRPLVVGAVASGVARVVAVLKKAGTTKTTTVDVPLKPIAAVGRGIQFFVFTHQGFKVHAINVYDGSGKLLQHSLENPPKPKHP